MDKLYTQYYLIQSGGGLSDIGPLYYAPHFRQRGSGILGNIFSGLVKFFKPLISSGVRTLKDQSIKTGTAILQDIGNKPMHEILREHGKSAVKDLANKGIDKLFKKKQEGSGCRKRKCGHKGIKRKFPQHFNHLALKAKRRRSNKKRILDIFDK